MFKFITIIIYFFLIVFSAYSHPHMWIDVSHRFSVDSQGGLKSVLHVWKFDTFFTKTMLDSYDIDSDGKFSGQELIKLRNETFDSIGEYGYFTHMKSNNKSFIISKVEFFNAYIDKSGSLIYEFILKQKNTPNLDKDTIDISVYDDEFFIDFDYADIPVLWEGNYECKYVISRDKKNKIYFGTVEPFKLTLCIKN